MNFFLDDPMNSFVENLLMKSTEKAEKKKPAPGKYNPYDDSPLLAPTSHDGKDPDTPQYGKHWSRYTPRARMTEAKMKRRKELQLVLDTIEEKAKKKSGKDDDLSTYFTNRTSYKPFKMERGGPDKRSRNLSRNPGAKTPRIMAEDESHDRIARLADVRRRRGIPTMTGVRGKELQLVLDTIEEKAKKEPKPTKTPKPVKTPRPGFESAADRIARVLEEIAKRRGSSTKQLSGGEKVAVAQKAKKKIIVVPPFPKEGHDYVNGVNIPQRLDRYKRPMTRFEDGSYGSEPLKRRVPVKSKDGPTPPSSNKGNRLRNYAVKTTMPDRSVKYVDKRKRR